MLISVIVSTYNRPDLLEKALWGYAAQRDRGFELLIADDGSRRETRALVEGMAGDIGIPVRHVWQPDDGWRKCRILNAAIRRARGEYLIFTDGDCIPRPTFVGLHRRFGQPGRFLSSGYVRIGPVPTAQLAVADIRSGRALSYRWLRQHGAGLDRRLLKLAVPGPVAALLDWNKPGGAFNGCNSSVWLGDAVAVNGFEERMTYGQEDEEFGVRLARLGVRGMQVRNRLPIVHQHHAPYYLQTNDDRRQNADILSSGHATGRIRALEGLDRHTS